MQKTNTMETTTDFRLSMIPNMGKTIYYENELLLADNVDSALNWEEICNTDPLNLRLQVGFIMILFCRKGEITFLLNQKLVRLKANDVVIIKPNDIGEALKSQTYFELFVIGFSNTNYFENLYSSSVWEFRNFYLFNNQFSIADQDLQNYYMLYQMMRSRITDENFLPKKEFVSKSLTLMGVIFQNNVMKVFPQYKQQKNQRNILLFEQFIALAKKHFRKQHSLQFYANELCVTPKYMSQIINEVSGHFASDWIMRYLIDEAKTLLLDGNHTSCQVADALGFPNASYFTRFFKRETGLTPLQYQRK